MKTSSDDTSHNGFDLASTSELIAELALGRPTIVVDDADRENEGDLIIAADHLTERQMAFTIRYTCGVL
jgi:3,4-dihydroxy-2-butanone 4-phosphate synthase